MILRKFNIFVVSILVQATLSIVAMEERPAAAKRPEYFEEILRIARANNPKLYKHILEFKLTLPVETKKLDIERRSKQLELNKLERERKSKERELMNIYLEPLLNYIRKNDIDSVISLLDQVPDFDLNIAGLARNPLVAAIISNDVDLVELLISKGANINFTFYKGTAPALQVIKSPEMIQLFNENGANWKLATDADTGAPILVQIIENEKIEPSQKVEMIKLLAPRIDINEDYRKHGDSTPSKSALIVAKELGDERIIQLLENLGAK